MTKKKLSARDNRALLTALAPGTATVTQLEVLISKGYVPARLKWQPDLCIIRGKDRILVHTLVSSEFPAYLETAILQLRKPRFKRTYVLLLGKDIVTEAEEGIPPPKILAPIVTANVAEKALELGCALAFESEQRIHIVFDKGHRVLPPHACGEETGHVPGWLYTALANSSGFSPHLNRALKAFATEYRRATKKKIITNDREADLLFTFAKRFTRGEPRLFFPIGQLSMLREYEMAQANKRTRDHFFHTFNNLFLGFHILGAIYGHRKWIADIDHSIEDSSGASKVHPWESLWFLTCMFHDPAYIAEKFWGTFRFSYGVKQDQGSEDQELPDSVAQAIRDMWDSAFVGPRRDLRSLYNRTIRKWIPPTLRKTNGDAFDNAVQKAYFDGRNTSHSLVSGLRLINLCVTQNVPRSKKYEAKTSLIACEIAALCMMFHDQRCRAILTAQGIPPIAFERLPYASLLMFVDALQDDRRDISISRFRDHGILKEVNIRPGSTAVEAAVCLREVLVKGWAPRIAEYESVMNWINSDSEIRFIIDYKTEAGL